MNRKAILILLATTALVALGFFSLGAVPSHEIETTYYSDASKTQIVGESTLTCNSGYFSWGQTTPHSDVVSRECGSPQGGCRRYVDGIPIYVPCPRGY